MTAQMQESPGRELERISELGNQIAAKDQALQEARSSFDFLLEAMPLIVFRANADGHATHFNHFWFRYSGEKPGDLLSWQRVLHPDDLPHTVRGWQECVQDGSPFQAEVRLRAADGQYRWHLGQALPMKDAWGEILLWVGTYTDIHAQHVSTALCKEILEETLEHE